MNTSKILGHCPYCGNAWAFVRGGMSSHGYSVEHGYFEGTCQGAGHAPIEMNRLIADEVIEGCRVTARSLIKDAACLRAGELLPRGKTVQVGGFGKNATTKFIPWEEMSPYEKAQTAEIQAYAAERRAKQAVEHAEWLEKAVAEFHGKPLVEVAKPAAPAPIKKGDTQVYPRGPVSVQYVDGARVYWIGEDGRKGWTGTQAWRRAAQA